MEKALVGGFSVIVKLRENCLLYPAAAELRPAAASSSLSRPGTVSGVTEGQDTTGQIY